MPLLNYTTTVSAEKTATEIQRRLVAFGATSIATDYADREPVALTFVLEGVTQSGRAFRAPFRLPINVEGVAAALKNARVERRWQVPAQVQRTAWRILKDWVEAQLAVIEAGLARPEQILLPFAVSSQDGRTLYEHFDADPTRLLSA